jgi:probable rRNA maturation factor
MAIYLDIINKTGYIVIRKKIESVINKILAEKGIQDPIELSLVIVNEIEMADLHFKYMETREATDVLSFPTEEAISADGVRHLGDIVVCEKFISDHRQLEFLFEHGLRHLLGEHHD